MDAIRLEARGARKAFFRKGRESAQHFDAVSPADLQLAGGELVVLKGRSGSGKTTLLNMMAGLLEPTEGNVLLDGIDLYALDDASRSRLRNERIGVIPQGHTALGSLSVVHNVMLPYLMYREDDGCEACAMDLLESLGIRQLADSYPSELSGGELRRVCVARALICAPDVVLADEPTGNLDDESTLAVLGMLRERAESGAAVLVVTHEQVAERFADRVLRMEAGTLATLAKDAVPPVTAHGPVS